MVTLQLQDFSVERRHWQLEGLSLQIFSGQTLCVMGENGSGKTTFLRSLLDLFPKKRGHISCSWSKPATSTAPKGSDSLSLNTCALNTCAHYLGHQNALRDSLSAPQHLEFWRNIFPCSLPRKCLVSDPNAGRQKISEMLEILNLQNCAHLPIAQLSQGQRRRLAFGRLLIVWRPFWILDEPFTALDENGQHLFLHHWHQHTKEGGIVIAALHQKLSFPPHQILLLNKDGTYTLKQCNQPEE